MWKSGLCYFTGFLICIVYLLASELIWVPAPLLAGSGMHWIEMIDWLFYGLALAPLSWACGAWGRLRLSLRGAAKSGERVGLAGLGGWHKALLLLRLALALAGVAGAFVIFFMPERLELALIAVAGAAILAMFDLLATETMQRGSTQALSSQSQLPVTEGKRTRPGRFLAWFPRKSAVALLLLAGVLLVLLYPTGYRVTYPGMTLGMNRYAHAEGGQGGGYIDGVLVFERPAVPIDMLLGKFLSIYDFEKIPEGEPPFTETYAQVAAMKTDANQLAEAVAMGKAGLGTGITTEGVRIAAIVKDSPADGRLQAGDVIVKLNDQPVAAIADLTQYMERNVKPGDSVSITVRRDGENVTIDVQAIASQDNQERPVFGISVQNELHLDIPKHVAYKRYMAHIGGPSHGAMLTLAIIDQLTPGGVTNGWRVAGTGTIEPDGTIGRIGGIRQKAYAVSRTDANVFFVPASQVDEAQTGAPELRIVGVETIDDVLTWLAGHRP